MQQVNHLHPKFDKLQLKYGAPSLNSIYGAGYVNSPKIMFIFMNPTGRNIASNPDWKGLRAPWLGTKQIWGMFAKLDLINSSTYSQIQNKRPEEWGIGFSKKVYSEIQNNNIYISNLAKCTQIDARHLSDSIFKEYLALMIEEIKFIRPQKIVTFGNQVSSIILRKPISVSSYEKDSFELLNLNQEYHIYPTFYPVGQGRRNLPKAIERIRLIM